MQIGVERMLYMCANATSANDERLRGRQSVQSRESNIGLQLHCIRNCRNRLMKQCSVWLCAQSNREITHWEVRIPAPKYDDFVQNTSCEVSQRLDTNTHFGRVYKIK